MTDRVADHDVEQGEVQAVRIASFAIGGPVFTGPLP